MIYKIADNILSPLGYTTEENYAAVREGKSSIALHEGLWNIPKPFMASLFDNEWRNSVSSDVFSAFEMAVIYSIREALADTKIDVSQDNIVLIVSTTKGNIDLLVNDNPNERIYPGNTARHIAEAIGIRTMPIVVCNACISGLSAIILAKRLLEQNSYDYAIVCGCDMISKFVIAGFQSFQVLSDKICRPFDMERTGLNLGEAAATMIFSSKKLSKQVSSASISGSEATKEWGIECGAVRNDALHISSPSNKGEGLYRTLSYVMNTQDKDNIALINAHGTGTLFNDRMEAMAISRAGLKSIPLNALKGYFGHTMGAAGIIETILTMKSLDDDTILATKGFEEIGVSVRLNISAVNRKTDKHRFIKLLSGFGGCNAAIVASKRCDETYKAGSETIMICTHNVKITPDCVSVDGQSIQTECHGNELIKYLYKRYVTDYAKFYKMDMLSRLGFVASELLLMVENKDRFTESEDRAVAFFNRTASISADKIFLSSITGEDNYFPSPSAFVYTLPNIVTGEVAIRNHYHGETSFYLLPEKNDSLMTTILTTMFQDTITTSILGGWLDYEDDSSFEADICIYQRK